MDITKLRTAIKDRWTSVDIQFVGLKARDLAITLAVDEFINAAQEIGTNAAHASNTQSKPCSHRHWHACSHVFKHCPECGALLPK